MTAPLSDAHQSEFGSVAGWTAAALAGVDRASAVASACKGSASPAALAWLGECLALEPEHTILDVGAGLGGPAAWFADRFGVSALLVEPMHEALHGAAALFGHRGCTASATDLPFRSGGADRVLVLGVLDTLPDPAAALAEMRRVTANDGRLGLLAYVAQGEIPAGRVPEGNRFPTVDELLADLDAACFAVIDRTDAATLPPAPLDWRVRQDRTATVIADRHGGDEQMVVAERQADRFAELLSDGLVGAVLVHAVCV